MDELPFKRPEPEDWEGHVGQMFKAHDSTTDEALAELKLESCDLMGYTVPPFNLRAYTLIFTGSSQTPLQQSTYRFVRSGFEPEDIFIVPVAEASGIRTYQAVYS